MASHAAARVRHWAAQVGPESVGASEGFLGWIAYLGAANAGIPLSIIVKQYGWEAYFVALLAACAMVLLLMAPMVNLKSFVQVICPGQLSFW